MNASWSVPASVMSFLLVMMVPSRGSSDARRIGFSLEVPMFPNGRDEPVARRARVRGRKHAGIALAARQRRIDPAGREQLIAGAHRKDRLAVAVLVLDELEGPPVRTQGVDGL